MINFKRGRVIYGWLLVLEGKRKKSPFSSYEKKFSACSWASDLFTLDKIENERRYYRPGDKEITRRVPVVRY